MRFGKVKRLAMCAAANTSCACRRTLRGPEKTGSMRSDIEI